MAKMGRPRKVTDEAYETLINVFGKRSVRNWMQIEPLFRLLETEVGKEAIKKYFITDRGLAVRLMLAISRMPRYTWGVISKYVMADIDRGLSRQWIAKECINAYFILHNKEFPQEEHRRYMATFGNGA